ncbi:hypothetical protein [Streptomyces sp. NPDC051567]|uniref:hypothetical protein n=1 Tax=Streptomyces sp. NPDC051567 TaxID=3365660 RepID=UPI00378D766E
MNTRQTVRVIACTRPDELFRHFTSRSQAQPAYIELDLREASLLADYDSSVSNDVPRSVLHGFERRYPVPVLTAAAANRLMGELLPLAGRVLADWTQEWDGDQYRAVLGDDAQAAEAEILGRLRPGTGDGDGDGDQGFPADDLVGQWDLDAVVNGLEADDYEIGPGTTDERLREIEREILEPLLGLDNYPVVVCHGLLAHLTALRDNAETHED